MPARIADRRESSIAGPAALILLLCQVLATGISLSLQPRGASARVIANLPVDALERPEELLPRDAFPESVCVRQ
jgi:hypothetical protein